MPALFNTRLFEMPVFFKYPPFEMAASFAEEYEVDYGVYLFLGYSKKEEKLLKPYTKTASLVDAALVKLGKLVRDTAEIMNGVSWLTFEHSGLF